MKVKFLRVKIGSYKDKMSNEKSLYQTIGKLFIKDDGKINLLLDPTFNPAGVPESLRYNGQISVYVNDQERGNEDGVKSNQDFSYF